MTKRLAMFAACLGLTPVALAASSEAFPETISFGETSLIKSGQATYRLLGLFKAFDAALYLEEGYSSDAFPGPFHFYLSLSYHRAFTKEQLISRSRDILRDLDSSDTLGTIEERVAAINRIYENVEKGDQYALYYHPQKGTQLLLNGEPQTLVEGFDFAERYFAIWLGEHPSTRRLGDALLNRR